MHRFHRLRPLAAVALLALLIPAAAPPVRAQPLPVLRVATNPIENGAEVYYARAMGFFQKAGLDVEIQSIQSGSAVAGAVASNAVDVGFASLVPLAVAHNKNIPFVLIAPGAMWSQAAKNSGLFVAQTSPIKSGKDLNGKTLSTAGLGTLTEYAARAWIDGNGGDASTVKFVEMGYSTMPAALSAGRVDASLLNEPYLQAARKDGKLIGYPYDFVAKDFLIAGWFTSAKWASDHPDLVRRFAAAMRETAAWANDKANSAKSAEILVRELHLDPALVETMVRVRYGDTLAPTAVQPQIDVSAKYGGFKTFPAQEIIYSAR